MPVSTVSPPRRSRSSMIEETRARLLVAARHAFAEQGYANTSMDDFTAAAGLTRGALYHHFGSKEKLLLAVIDQLEGEVGERLQAMADAAPSSWQAFRRRCQGYLELALVPELRRIILQDARAMFGDVPQAHQSVGIAALQTALQGLIDEGVALPAHTGVTARMLYGAVTEAAFWIAEADGDPPARLAMSLAALDKLLTGLLADPASAFTSQEPPHAMEK
ncbi:TetR/AcrR family transcriptional regulator [Janthinobacterium sp. SUN100]|uniref:TetR/AcrR family transcriptional regulator n=1 Tax=Janthinobacterium sp. SUN100 TaxID=3004101 RepID=UPI0025B23DDA|nr:TetR/AcrR family transcriptional regulator [Janthinobacterium sp. SUN100]MDN2702583.1 TetR/AcrR family transcriptional regulator [Janthinobacterium sp. SUN100]